MSRTSHATPCPAPRPGLASASHVKITSTVGILEDDTCTTDLDYTRAIQQEFKNARPRRRANFARGQKNVVVDIFEDVLEDQELVIGERQAHVGKTLLSRPAQRLPVRPARSAEKYSALPLGEIGQARQRVPVQPDVQACPTVTVISPKPTRNALKKEPRRRTIFIPDDTTVLTIHPGANETHRLDDTFQLHDNVPLRPSAIAAQPMVNDSVEIQRQVRRARTSLAMAPRRVPLQQMAVKQENVLGVDIPGQNGGKENLPPNAAHLNKKGEDDLAGKSAPALFLNKRASSNSRLSQPTAASQARQTVRPRQAVPMQKAQTGVPKSRVVESERNFQSRPMLARIGPRTSPTANVRGQVLASPSHIAKTAQANGSSIRAIMPVKRQMPPKNSMLCASRSVSKLSQYPVLAEDVAQPQLYEESWLNHQEIALTELINEIFQMSNPALEFSSQTSQRLREHLLEIYHRPNVTALHQRLKASLLYGALSRPRDMPSAPNPALDIGLRKRFLRLWLDNYEEASLRAAVEVVIGRQISSTSDNVHRGLDFSERTLDPAKERRALVGFLETFFVLVEDVDDVDDDHHNATDDASGHRWRKMVLRSLMLIWLLDQGKVHAAVPGCLFKRKSTVKTSTSVLHNLSSMLVPSVGDITRAVRHFDYTLHYIQDPLDEVTYTLENIAIDLRDGVFLARLVEVLLFSPTQSNTGSTDGEDATVTITLPDLTVLESTMFVAERRKAPKVLSQHLKMPCLGRAQKLYNVQVSLGALSKYSGAVGGLLDEFTADDIVDGHREKTLALLWSLVSHHGLSRLVDWEELEMDVYRARGETGLLVGAPDSHAAHEDLLQAWAVALCAKNDVQLNNLTTAFADKKAYASILDAYSDFLPLDQASSRPSPSLESRLRALGCSVAFTRQFLSSDSIPSRTTTISNLAFLASRLLPLTRRHNAAVRIQRCFRRVRSRIQMSQRISLMRVAYACVAVVQTRAKIISAATTLQRAWRSILDKRVAALNADLQVFQAIARAWMVRRANMKAVRAGNQSLRVMGGW